MIQIGGSLRNDMNENETIIETFLSSVINTLNAKEIYDIIIDTLIRLLHPEGLLLMFNQQANRTYHIAGSWGNISYDKDCCTPGDDVMQLLLESDGLIYTARSSQILSAMTPRQQKWIRQQDICAFYTIKYNKAIIGFLFIADPKNPSFEQTESPLRKIFYYSAYALRNANLYQNAYRASITDELTSLYNRKYAFECINNCCQGSHTKSLILLDIDDFKLYNELYGAAEGDNLIHQCAQFILEEIGPADMGFRYGADEFLILAADCDADKASALASRIIDKIISSNPGYTVWDVTITCGISTFPEISKDAASFLHNAEQAVYYGKQGGKGHISVYRQGMEVRAQNPDIRSAYERVAPTIYALTAAIDAKDSYTFIHSMNVSKYAVILAEALGMNANDIEVIRDAGLLHDIGKISIPEHILQKTSRLTPEEYEVMKTHVENSTKMIRYLPDMDYVIPAVVGHHERYDGKGYPRGLSGENIPYMARILTVADCFDAMTAQRPYKQPLSVSYAINELQNNSGTQFDPELVAQFIKLIYDGKIVV